MRAALFAAFAFAASPALAQPVVTTYACEHGARIEVAYVTEGPVSVAVIAAEGRLRVLSRGPSASGARYTVPDGTSGHVWWTRGQTARLAWFDAETGEEVTLYSDCHETG